MIALIVMSSTSLNAAWQTVTHGGKKYVTSQEIKVAFGFTDYKVSGSTHTLTKKGINLKLSSGSHNCFMNSVKFIFSYPVIRRGGSLLISETDVNKVITPVLRPAIIQSSKAFRTIVIDPGHGGKDAGAVNRYGTEAGYNLKVAKVLAGGLRKRGFNVVMTRESNVFLSLQQRVSLANKYSDAIFISIHFNSASRSAAKGIETFTLSPAGVSHYGRGVKRSDYNSLRGNQQDSANIALATAIHGQVLKMTKPSSIYDRGIKRARFSVLTKIKHPAILIEGGFMSNPTEAKILDTTRYQQQIATGIYKGILRYQNALNSGGSSNRSPDNSDLRY